MKEAMSLRLHQAVKVPTTFLTAVTQIWNRCQVMLCCHNDRSKFSGLQKMVSEQQEFIEYRLNYLTKSEVCQSFLYLVTSVIWCQFKVLDMFWTTKLSLEVCQTLLRIKLEGIQKLVSSSFLASNSCIPIHPLDSIPDTKIPLALSKHSLARSIVSKVCR